MQTKLSQLQENKLNLLTYSDFPCNLKVNRDKLALKIVYVRVKRAKEWRLPLILSRKYEKLINTVRMRTLRPLQEPIRSQDLLFPTHKDTVIYDCTLFI